MSVEHLAGWSDGFVDSMARIAGRFGQGGATSAARAFLLGLLSAVGGRNGWTLAEAAGDRTRDGMGTEASRMTLAYALETVGYTASRWRSTRSTHEPGTSTRRSASLLYTHGALWRST